MTQITEAIYTNGVLKPTRDLDLREQQRVRVIVETIECRTKSPFGMP
jgi:predicted DNA-binding antitoxin AbrB/MazE fold protein